MKIVLAPKLGHDISHKKKINLTKETIMFPKNYKLKK